MRILLITFVISLTHFFSSGQGNVRPTASGHYLQLSSSRPFFYLGDTGWELFQRLNLNEIKIYLDNRAAKGFNVIQAVALADLTKANSANQYGEKSLINGDPATPNERYFMVIDSTVHMARVRNLFIGLLPCWGDKVMPDKNGGPVIFDSINAFQYGKWLGNRYKNDSNIIWILGGDHPALNSMGDWRPVWRAMANGIKEGTGNKCFITYHPGGGPNSTSQWIHNESWLQMNMFQSGHGDGHDVACWNLVKRDWSYKPAKPTLDGEPNYEDHPVSPWPKWNPDNGYFRDYDVRKQIYRSVFAGAAGVTYGHHAVWQFVNEKTEVLNFADRGWVNAMDRPGAFQAGYLRKLIESRPHLERIPDSSIIAGGQGRQNNEHVEAFRAEDNSYCMIYMPVGNKITVNIHFMKGDTIAWWWFNPKDGSYKKELLVQKSDIMNFVSPTKGAENDWVLVIDDASYKYPAPGSRTAL